MMKNTKILISKSRYMSGLRCDKLLWCTYNQKDLFPPFGKATEGRFAQGHEVGELATHRFPGGQEAAPGKYYAEDTVPPTIALLEKRIPIFEAGFVNGSAYVKVDILDPVGDDQWDLYEVKSTTSYSAEKHLADVAIQKYAVQGNGLKVRNCYLMHLNNQYIRDGDIDPEALMAAVDVTGEVEMFIDRVGGDLETMLEIIQQGECPDIPVGPYCLQIRQCDLYPVCWDGLPEHHPVTLYSGKQKGFELLESGVTDLKDVGDDTILSNKQAIQVEAVKSGEIQTDISPVNDFLSQLEYPLSFLDFETLGSAVPLYDKTRPYQAIGFQFSLHVVKEPGEEPEHHAFLAEGTDDPRPNLLEALLAVMPLTGSVVAYNSSFEARILRDLAEYDPSCQAWVGEVNSRMVDLLRPFSSFAVYHPDQHGSASMKAVLPALTGFGYEGIDMGGEDAGYEFIRITFEEAEKDDVRTTRTAMEEYCKLDTEGMILLVEKLRELSGT
jgi:hypothetical protein